MAISNIQAYLQFLSFNQYKINSILNDYCQLDYAFQSKQNLMTVLYIQDLISLINFFNKNGEMMMAWLMSRSYMKLIEIVHHAHSFDPNFVDFCVFKLVLPGVVVLVDLGHCLLPCVENLGIWLSYYLEAHAIYICI